jgi:hypothetical protein
MTRRLLILALAAGLLTLAGSAQADVVKPLVILGPTTVLNGTAVVSGTLGLPGSVVELTINGQPVAVDVAGSFAATVNLGGASRLTLAVRNSKGETMTTSIPLTTNIFGPGGLLAPSVLADLEHAGVMILKPLDGFKIFDNLPLRVEGSVLDKDKLAELKVNGFEILGQIGADHHYSVRVPGTTKEITLSFTDRQGASQTIQVPVEHPASPPASAPSTPASPVGRTVEASQAVGVRIARVRYFTKGIRRTKRLRVVVTVKDRRGFLVRNASVSVRSVKPRWILRNPKAKRTTGFGQASFVLTAGQRAFGKRLKLVIRAKTPHAKQRKAGSVPLPSRTRSATARRK